MPQHGSHRPRRGSMGFWHRKRASRIYPRIKAWPEISKPIPVAFVGYKVGMTHVFRIEENKNSHLAGMEVFTPVTIVEVPPIKVLGIRLYKKTSDGYKALTDIIPEVNDKVARKIKNIKPSETKVEDAEKLLDQVARIKLIIHTQPWLAGIRKKTPEVLEIPLGGDVKSAWEYAKNVLGKEITIKDVFQEGEYIDVISVTKGKGFEGVVKRFGVKIYPRPYKTDKKARAVQSKGAWGMRKIFPTTPFPGQMGFHRRTELNKLILKISDNPNEINPKSGWPHYGIVRSTWIAIKGSVGGAIKRLIVLRKSIRNPEKILPVKVTYVSLMNKN